MTERVEINYDIDKETGLTFIECRVDDTMLVRVSANFIMTIFDKRDGGEGVGYDILFAEFRRSFEALMAEFDERYGGRP